MTAVDVDALAKLLEAGSVGPWSLHPNFAGGWGLEIMDGDGLAVRWPSGLTEADAALIVAAVNALPDLIAEVRRGRALRQAVEGLLAAALVGEGWDAEDALDLAVTLAAALDPS